MGWQIAVKSFSIIFISACSVALQVRSDRQTGGNFNGAAPPAPWILTEVLAVNSHFQSDAVTYTVPVSWCKTACIIRVFVRSSYIWHVYSVSVVTAVQHSGHYMYRQFNIQQFCVRSAHTVYLCVLCGSENKQRLFPYTALTDWFV